MALPTEHEKKVRYVLTGSTLHDETQPGNPVVASLQVVRVDGKAAICIDVCQVVKNAEGEEVPCLSPRSALELAALLI